METKRGHSNACIDETDHWPDCDDVALIPISGGANFATCRELPPLVLRKAEWEKIGRRMGWTAAASDLVAALNAAVERMEAVAARIPVKNRAKGVTQATHVSHMAGHLAEHAKKARNAIARATGSRKSPANPDGVKTIIHSLQQFRQMSGGVVCEMDTSRGRLVSHQHDERTDLHALAGEILAENGGSPTERFAFDSELPEWATGSRKTPTNPDGVDVEALE